MPKVDKLSEIQVTYIHHSSFLVETRSSYLLFDYTGGHLPEWKQEKRVYVFVSHRHWDHFSAEIFSLCGEEKRISYILSDDIAKNQIPGKLWDSAVFLGPDQVWEHEGLKAAALKSTDEGVAYLIGVDGKTIYHAGDLNDWYWEGETQAYNAAMADAYHYEIGKMAELDLDIAFVVLDPRQGKAYDRGIRYFLEHVRAGAVYPMHCWGDAAVIDRCRNEAWAKPWQACIKKLPWKQADR